MICSGTSERGRRCDEALEIITNLWTGKLVTHKGIFYDFANYGLGATPSQKPHPPIWAGGTAKGVLRRIARWCDGFLPQTITPKEYLAMWDQIHVFGEEFARDTSMIAHGVQFYYSLASNKEEARRLAEETLSRRYQRQVSFTADDEYW